MVGAGAIGNEVIKNLALLGDHWSAGQSLAELIVRIGEMICYQSYNTKSPLNARAAAWVETHTGRLPLDGADLWAGI